MVYKIKAIMRNAISNILICIVFALGDAGKSWILFVMGLFK
jgi:hypothetical protein